MFRTDPPCTTQWEEGYQSLVAYKAEHGHVNVPEADKTANDYSLGIWVATQRAARKRGALSSERIARLDGIGFDWRIR